MKKVFTSESLVTVAHYRNLLQAEGIACEVRKENLGSVMGEIPFTELWPELWVKHDLDAARARELIAEAQSAPVAHGRPWRCTHCGELNEYQFSICWNCEGALEEP